MAPSKPSEVIRRFIDLFNTGDLDDLIRELYDDEVVLLVPGSEQVGGIDGVRKVLEGLLSMNGRMTLLGSTQVVNGAIALSVDHWRVEGPDGEATEGHTSDVLRRQADGSWKYFIDNPIGPAAVQPI